MAVKTKTVKFIQHMKATNDADGNPRRLWIGHDADGEMIEVRDEGYGGKPADYRKDSIKELPSWSISISEYTNTIRNAKGDGMFFPA